MRSGNISCPARSIVRQDARGRCKRPRVGEWLI